MADCGAAPGAALADGLATLADTVLASIDRLGDALTAENIHELRIDISKLSAALLVASNMMRRKAPRHLQRRLRHFRRCLSSARDWDVFSAHRESMGAGGCEAFEIDLLRAEAARRRLDQRDRIALLLRSKSCFALKDALYRVEQRSLDPASRLRSAGIRERESAIGWLGAAASKVQDAGRHPNRLDFRDLHRMRARVKRLRYASEFLQPLFQGDVRPYAGALADLQKTLGRLNDSHVALRLARELHPRVVSATTLHSIAAQHQADSVRLRKSLRRRIAALRRLTPFWDAAPGQPALTTAGT
ncbi:MAG TPA: CHAD domain-containing protein [Nevskia sp.]|nr:CHAD domain-containing protein [Nevskia sp.]